MYVLLSDVIRYVSVILSFLLAAAGIRLIHLRMTKEGPVKAWRKPSQLPGALGVMTMLMLGSTRRFNALGEPADFFVWGYFVGVLFFVWGARNALQVDWRPPWRRHPPLDEEIR